MAAAEGYLAAARAASETGTDAAVAARRFAAIAAEAPAGYRTLARLRAAALRAEAGERDAALAEWDAIARDGSVEAHYRDLASVLWGMQALENEDARLRRSRRGWRRSPRQTGRTALPPPRSARWRS